jgi:hypothetical protein
VPGLVKSLQEQCNIIVQSVATRTFAGRCATDSWTQCCASSSSLHFDAGVAGCDSFDSVCEGENRGKDKLLPVFGGFLDAAIKLGQDFGNVPYFFVGFGPVLRLGGFADAGERLGAVAGVESRSVDLVTIPFAVR